MGVELRTPVAGEHAGIRALLVRGGLPVDDLDTSAIDFLVAVADGGVVGVVGLEAHGEAGLLRSLAVDPSRRSTGTGGALVEAVEARARQRGLRQLVLLTQTAEPFFARRGYGLLARDAVPAAIRASAEFSAICPASATCMSKSLAGEAAA